MGQQRYIMSAVLILLFVFLLIGTFIKIPDWKTPKSDAVKIRNDPHKRQMSASEEEGKELYVNRCMTCHTGFNVDDGSSVMLANLVDRWPDKQELIAYIKNSNDDELKNSNNVKNSRKRYPANFSNQSHSFKDLTELQVQKILDYFHWEDTRYIEPTN